MDTLSIGEHILVPQDKKENKFHFFFFFAYFFKLYGLLNINSIKSPGVGKRPQKNDSPKYARCMVCPLYGVMPVLTVAAGLLWG